MCPRVGRDDGLSAQHVAVDLERRILALASRGDENVREIHELGE